MKEAGSSLARNSKAFKNYSFNKIYVAGIVLVGSEIKSLREGRSSINEAYIQVKLEEAFLINSYIGIYSNSSNYSITLKPYRERKLLLTKRELANLTGTISRENLTAIPIKIFLHKNLAKLEFGIGHSKKQYDKRKIIQKRDTEREIRRSLKNKNRP